MLKKIVIKLSGNKFAQQLLEKNITISSYLSGVGSGGSVLDSGEKVAVDLLSHFPGPYTIFDVGANKGQYLNMVYSQLGNKDFKIHSFEPGKFTFETLRKNAPASEKVNLNNMGLGEKEGEFTLYYDSQGSGLASLTKRKLDHLNMDFSGSENIQLTTLDNYCEKNDIKSIHLIKLDVEGHELDVLKGSAKMFESRSIKIVTFEFGGTNIDTRTYLQDFFYFFKEQQMELFRITPSGFLFPITKYKEQYEQFLTTNYIAIST